MAKRIIMIAPFDVLTGNLSGKQDIRYANDNKAYEEPNGSAGALNYKPRFIGARRSDGRTYFSVRTRQTSVLNAATRMQMALIGAIAAIKSELKAHPLTWEKVKSAYDYAVEHDTLPQSVTSFNKFVDYYLRDMLRYKRASWSFNAASISFTIANPFDLMNENALQINQKIWNKFVQVLWRKESGLAAPSFFTIDGKQFVAAIGTSSWGALKNTPTCPNLELMWSPITISAEKVQYQGLQVYSAAGSAQTDADEPESGKYTTIAPM